MQDVVGAVNQSYKLRVRSKSVHHQILTLNQKLKLKKLMDFQNAFKFTDVLQQ